MQRHRQHVRVGAADVAVQRAGRTRRPRPWRPRATRRGWRSHPAGPCWACRRGGTARRRGGAGRGPRGRATASAISPLTLVDRGAHALAAVAVAAVAQLDRLVGARAGAARHRGAPLRTRRAARPRPRRWGCPASRGSPAPGPRRSRSRTHPLGLSPWRGCDGCGRCGGSSDCSLRARRAGRTPPPVGSGHGARTKGRGRRPLHRAGRRAVRTLSGREHDGRGLRGGSSSTRSSPASSTTPTTSTAGCGTRRPSTRARSGPGRCPLRRLQPAAAGPDPVGGGRQRRPSPRRAALFEAAGHRPGPPREPGDPQPRPARPHPDPPPRVEGVHAPAASRRWCPASRASSTSCSTIVDAAGPVDVIARARVPPPLRGDLRDARDARRRPRAAARVVAHAGEVPRAHHRSGRAPRRSSPRATTWTTTCAPRSRGSGANPADDLLSALIAVEEEGDGAERGRARRPGRRCSTSPATRRRST